MPSRSPTVPALGAARLKALGQQVRARRRALRVSATAAAEAAGISRVTLHRIEKGAPSVTIGAWASVLESLGLQFSARAPEATVEASPTPDLEAWIPVRVRLDDYPQLRSLAWQVHGTDALTPAEALDLYERNARHIDVEALSAAERALLHALRAAFGRSHV
jgi:transcriptional regulator with XRE-family HTH domain